jgi:hypothetical protein
VDGVSTGTSATVAEVPATPGWLSRVTAGLGAGNHRVGMGASLSG